MSANAFAHLASQVAAEHGIPKGIFLALVNQESGFRPDARSSVGAYGLTQLMPATAKSLGVNLADPRSQLEGGARYLQQQYQRFGNWRQALAAYNAGPGNVANGAWQSFPETTAYVRNILGNVGKFGGIVTKPPVGAGVGETATTAPQAATPVIRGSGGLNRQAFALSLLDNLGDPGASLGQLAAGKFDAKTPSFSQQLQTVHGAPPNPDNPALPGKGAAIVKTAMTQMGQPYQWGGQAKLGSHTDCSGLVQAVMAANGIKVPRTTYQQWRTGKPVPINQLQPGDAVFFHVTDKGPGHVGIYIGQGRFINDPHTGAAVRIDNLRGYPGFVGARRFS